MKNEYQNSIIPSPNTSNAKKKLNVYSVNVFQWWNLKSFWILLVSRVWTSNFEGWIYYYKENSMNKYYKYYKGWVNGSVNIFIFNYVILQKREVIFNLIAKNHVIRNHSFTVLKIIYRKILNGLPDSLIII